VAEEDSGVSEQNPTARDGKLVVLEPELVDYLRESEERKPEASPEPKWLAVVQRPEWEPYTGAPSIGPPESHEDRSGRTAEEGFSGSRTAQIVGVSYRQLDYWARTDLIRPSLADTGGSGSRRRYSYRDLLELKVIKNLLDARIKLESVRVVFEFLRAHLETDITSAHLVIEDNQIALCTGEELVDVLRRGQGLLNVLPLAGVKKDLDEVIGGVRPDRHRTAS
jgi:DNA-binding transcriptional MerR regulator